MNVLKSHISFRKYDWHSRWVHFSNVINDKSWGSSTYIIGLWMYSMAHFTGQSSLLWLWIFPYFSRLNLPPHLFRKRVLMMMMMISTQWKLLFISVASFIAVGMSVHGRIFCCACKIFAYNHINQLVVIVSFEVEEMSSSFFTEHQFCGIHSEKYLFRILTAR